MGGWPLDGWVGGRVALGLVGGRVGGPWMGGWPLDGCVWVSWMDELAMVCIVAEPVGGS